MLGLFYFYAMNITDVYQKFLNSSSVCTDTRKLTKDCMYFALKGDSFDGNTFAKQALEEGAKYCIVDDESVVESDHYILVNDVLQTLQQLANYHRNTLKTPIIALTGSNGKTTTKELIHAVLKTSYKVKATIGNLNNHIGVPLSLLRLEASDDYGIIEMGANHQREIAFLCSIAEPDYGLITNFGKAHLEGFGGIEGVIKGKSELYDHLKANDKTIFVNMDDAIQKTQVGDYTKITPFGTSEALDICITNVSADPFVVVNYEGSLIQSQLIGGYNFGNIAVAIAIGHHFKISKAHIKSAIESYNPDNNRSEIINKGTNKIILDAYNANPSSMMAALQNFIRLEDNSKILFLGDMFELGDYAEKEHQAIVNFLESDFEGEAHICGQHFYATKVSSNDVHKHENFEALKTVLGQQTIEGSTLLIKGSRGMALERILELL